MLKRVEPVSSFALVPRVQHPLKRADQKTSPLSSQISPLLSPARVILGSDTFNIPPIFLHNALLKGWLYEAPLSHPSDFFFVIHRSCKKAIYGAKMGSSPK